MPLDHWGLPLEEELLAVEAPLVSTGPGCVLGWGHSAVLVAVVGFDRQCAAADEPGLGNSRPLPESSYAFQRRRQRPRNGNRTWSGRRARRKRHAKCEDTDVQVPLQLRYASRDQMRACGREGQGHLGLPDGKDSERGSCACMVGSARTPEHAGSQCEKESLQQVFQDSEEFG